MKQPATACRVSMAIALVVAMAPALAARPPQAMAATEAIRAAIAARVGLDTTAVEVLTVDLPPGAGDLFIEAIPDPGARLGGPMRLRLTRAEARSVTAVATVRVSGDRVVTRREIRRGEILGADDVHLARGEWPNVPLRRLPTIDRVIGSRARLPLSAEAIVLPGAVTFRRAVEPGDRVTVLAVSGGVEVSASLVAANGGEPGDVIRVINPDTKRDVRARVLKAGVVEVSHAR